MTVKELLHKAESEGREQHCRPADYNRNAALTEFIAELEEFAKDKAINFELINASVSTSWLAPKDRAGRNIKPSKKRALLNNYATFIYGEEMFYVSFNDNPLFPNHYYRVPVYLINQPMYMVKSRRYYDEAYAAEYKHITLYTIGDETHLTIEDVYGQDGNINKIKARFWAWFKECQQTIRVASGRQIEIKPSFYFG